MKLRTDNGHSMLKGLKLSPRIMHVGLFLVLASSILGSMLSIYFAQKVYAYDDTQVTATWVDASTVTVNIINATITDGDLKLPLADAGGTFYDNNVYDDTANYKNYAQESDCRSQLFANPKTPSTAKLRLHAKNPATGKCVPREEVIKLKSTENANFWFEWVDKGRIKGLSTEGFERNAIFTLNDITKTFLSSYSKQGCHDYITVGTDKRIGVFTQLDKDTDEPNCDKKEPKNHNVGIKYSDTKGNIEAGQGDTGLPNNNEDTGQGAESCESSTGSFGWVECPAIDALSGGINMVDTWIQGQLQTSVQSGSQDMLKAAWVRIRDIAYIILVPMMLVMVIGTALNIGPFDAYTVKKALPRMVAGVIFIALSWYICLFTINITNVFGGGVKGIIEQPFTSAISARCPPETGITLACLFDQGIGQAAQQWIGFAASAVALILILIFFFPAMLMMLILTFGTLILRRIFVLALLLVSPLAIIPWIFPGKDKLWKAWWGSFSKLLIVYPLIMILITMGHVFALLIDQTDAAGSANFLIKIAAYVLPLAFIPAAFKFAGGAFATLTGMANDKSKGLFGGAKKRRQNRYKHLGERAKADFFKGGLKPTKEGFEGNRRGRLNSRIQKVAHAKNAFDRGILAAPGSWRQNIGAAIAVTDAVEQQHIMEDKAIQTWAMRDDVSGLVDPILGGDAQALRRRLMMKGVGVRTRPKIGEDGQVEKNEDGTDKIEIYRDANGNMEVINPDVLDGAVESIMSSVNSGDRAGAFRKAFELTGAYSTIKLNGDGSVQYLNTDVAEMDRNVSAVIAATRKYGDEPLRQASVKFAVKGGTYYDKAIDMFHAVESATGHDGMARAEMVGSIRGMATNAGRAESGGGAFGASLNLVADIHEIEKVAKTEMAKKTAAGISTTLQKEIDIQTDKLQARYQRHVIENTPASVLVHQQMKEGYFENNVLPIMTDRLLKAQKAAEGKSEDTPEFALYMKLAADADNMYQQTRATKPALAKILGDKFMTLELEPARAEQRPTGLLDSRGNPIIETVLTSEPLTLRGAISKYKTNKIYQGYHQEWVTSEDALRQQQQEQLRYMQQQGLGGNPSGPIAPPPTSGP